VVAVVGYRNHREVTVSEDVSGFADAPALTPALFVGHGGPMNAILVFGSISMRSVRIG
jgi:hypothetical protein